MRLRLLPLAAGATLAALPATAALAASGLGPVTGVDVHLTSVRPAASSGLVIDVRGKPPAAGTTEYPGVHQIVTLPAGTRVDTRAATLCHATVAQLEQQGAEGACPRASRIGSGRADGVYNGNPAGFDLAIYAFPGALSFAAEQDGKPLKQGFFARIGRGHVLTFDVPTLNGAIAPTRFVMRLPARAHGGHRLVTTPRSCPRSGLWRSRASFQGLSAVPGGHPVGRVQRRTATTPCR